MEKTLIFALVVFSIVRVEATLPEDPMTDSNEELARFKRGSFVESILKHFPFFKQSFDSENEKETDEDTAGNSDPDALSFFTTNNELGHSVSEEQKASENGTQKSEHILPGGSVPTPSLMPMPASTFHVNSNTRQSTDVAFMANSSSIDASSLQHLITVSVALNHSMSIPTADDTVKSMMATTVRQTSSDNLLQSTPITTNVYGNTTISTPSLAIQNASFIGTNISATTLSGAPLNATVDVTKSAYLPPIPSSELNFTVRPTEDGVVSSIPLANVGNSTQAIINPRVANRSSLSRDSETDNSIPSVAQPPMVKTSDALSTRESIGTVNSDILHKRFRIPVMIGNAEDRNVRFLYINIIIPIVSGIMGAMLITFGIMMFRCCRRRKLKKVRYFGGKPSPDLVGLDRMNLLSESSDDEYYH